MASPRLTQRELRAIGEALAARLAGEIDEGETGLPPEVYESAQEKIAARVDHGGGPRRMGEFLLDGPSLPELDAYGGYADERQEER